MAAGEEGSWDLAEQRAHVSGGYDALVVHREDDSELEGDGAKAAHPFAGRDLSSAGTTACPGGLDDHATEARDIDAAKVKSLLNIKALAQDQQLAGDRRKASSSYLGTGRSAGQREAKDIGKLLVNLHQQAWRKSATTGNAEPLIRARRDVELCEAVQSDLALCTSSSRAPALLWSSKPPKNSRRLGSFDMISSALPEEDLHHFHPVPVGQDLETLKRITYIEQGAKISGVEAYAGTEGEPGSPTGLSHTIARKSIGDIHAEIQVSPLIAATVHVPKDNEEFRKARAIWPAASGIGSLGPTFGTSRSLFDIKNHGIQEAEMVPSDAYDVATLAKCTDFASVTEVAAGHRNGQTADGLNTIAPQQFGIKTFTSHPDLSAESPAGIRSPDRAGRPIGFDMMMAKTHPQQRSPRQHRRSLNLERGEDAQDEKHRMARSIASFRDVVPSTILEVTENYQEFYPTSNHMPTEASRAAALPFLVNTNSLLASSNSKLPSVYYVGDGIVAADAASPKATQDAPKLPTLTAHAPPVFTVSGKAIPSTAVSENHMVSTLAVARQTTTASSHGPPNSMTPASRPGTGAAWSRPATQDRAHICTPTSPYFTLPNTPNNPAETGIIFINTIGDVNQSEVDSFYPHFEEFTLGGRTSRGSEASRFSTPQTDLSLPTASSVTRHITSSDTTRDLCAPSWTVPRTPLTKPEKRARDPLRPPVMGLTTVQAPKKLSPPRTPRMPNAQPPAAANNSALRLKKSDALGDLFHAREGFKVERQFVASVQVAVDDHTQHAYWDTQTLWHVGGMLILESAPYDQLVSTWRPAKRGVQGHFEEEHVHEAKLTRGCHVDEVILLQERTLKDKPFALDIVSAEMRGSFTSKFVWKKGLTGLRAERGDELRVYRARDGRKVYGEFQGYPGVVPALSIQISNKVKKHSLTVAVNSAKQLSELVTTLHALVPRAGLRMEPRTALLNAFGREGIAKKKSRDLQSGLQEAFGAAYARMVELTTLVEQEHDMLQGQADKAILIGIPRRQVMAKDLKNLPASTLSNGNLPPHPSIKNIEALCPSNLTPDVAANLSPSRRVTIAEPPTVQQPATPSSPLSRRVHTPPSKKKSTTGRLVKFGVCATCEKHGQCMVNVPKYCVRCALKSFNDNLNRGDFRQASVACHHVQQLTHQQEQAREVTVGENSALATRCQDAHSRLEEASRLNNLRDLYGAAHCGDDRKITELATCIDIDTSVGDLEWVPNKGFLSSRSVLRGFTAAHYACMAFTGLEVNSKKDALIRLVQLGLDPHRPADDGRLPMHISVNEMPCLRYLIFEQKGDPEWRDGDGRTVLHHAALYGGLECRIFLVGLCDADHTAKDDFNKTPVDYSDDIALLVRKKRSLKMICTFFKHVMVMKCFYIMKRYKKEPPYMLQFVPTEERKQNINLAARVVRRRLYHDWGERGHPRLLKPWSSLLLQKSGDSIQSELSRLSSLEWSNALEWSWYIGHDSPEVLSPCDSPVWEYWGGTAKDFDSGAPNIDFDEDVNMTVAEHGLSLSVSAFTVHYDAKVVYKLESRPPTADTDGIKRVRTPKDSAKRTRKPDIDLVADGSENLPEPSRVWSEAVSNTNSASILGRLGSFTRALSISSWTRAMSAVSGRSSASQRDHETSGHSDTGAADGRRQGTSVGAKAVAVSFVDSATMAGASRGASTESSGAAVLRGAASFKRAIIPPG